MAQITYDDKVALYENTDIADINKVKASDMNEIKASVNNNDDMLNGKAVAGNMIVDSIRAKNLLDISGIDGTNNGITSSVKNQKLSVNGTLSGTWANLGINLILPISLEQGKTYTFSINKTLPMTIAMQYNYSSGRDRVYIGAGNTYETFTPNQDVVSFYIFITGMTSGTSVNITDLGIMVEEGAAATTYTPYQNLNFETQSKFNYATINSTYFNNGQVVWAKIGHIVLVEINNLQVSTTVPDHNSLVASGLPMCAGGINFYVFQHTSTNKARLKIINANNEGQIQTHYSGGMAVSNNQWYGVMWYITND